MVVDRHFHVPPCLDQIAGEANVLLARARVAARVVVNDDDGGGAERDGAGDDFADMDRGFVDAALPQRDLSQWSGCPQWVESGHSDC
jgi:hypothetical protein